MTLVSIFERQLALWTLTTFLLGQRPQGGRCCMPKPYWELLICVTNPH